MSRMSNDQIASIVALYRDDATATLEQVAEASEITVATVRKHVEAAGIVIREDAGAGYLSPSDEELGIGIEEAAPINMAAITRTPEFRDAVAQAVAEALRQVSAKPAIPSAPEGANSSEWLAFMQQMERLTESVNIQKPGYQKPLTPDELESRRAGEAEFFRLLREVRLAIADHGKQKAVALGLIPEYIVGENGFYGSTASGETLFLGGQRIYLTAPPPEDFLPMNESAAGIMRAQMQWLGEPTPSIEELVAQAMMRARGSDSLHIIGNEEPVHRDDASLVDPSGDIIDIGPKRTLGTSVPELVVQQHGPLSPGAATAPKGPVFVN